MKEGLCEEQWVRINGMVGCGCARSSTAVSSRSSLIVTPDRLASGTLSFIPRGISFPADGEGEGGGG